MRAGGRRGKQGTPSGRDLVRDIGRGRPVLNCYHTLAWQLLEHSCDNELRQRVEIARRAHQNSDEIVLSSRRIDVVVSNLCVESMSTTPSSAGVGATRAKGLVNLVEVGAAPIEAYRGYATNALRRWGSTSALARCSRRAGRPLRVRGRALRPAVRCRRSARWLPPMPAPSTPALGCGAAPNDGSGVARRPARALYADNAGERECRSHLGRCCLTARSMVRSKAHVLVLTLRPYTCEKFKDTWAHQMRRVILSPFSSKALRMPCGVTCPDTGADTWAQHGRGVDNMP